MLTPLEAEQLNRARAGDEHAFADLTETYRRELLVHCYRILGSSLDAEDAVQDTLLRAWKRLDTFTRAGSFRAWLYKIATNVCLDALDKRRRVLPTAAYPPMESGAPLPAPALDPIWLEPLPDEWLAAPDAAQDPEAHYLKRERVSLAFSAALQTLPPRQRAVFILRDVLDWEAKEVAQLLDMTVSAANSALHRARVSFSGTYPDPQTREPDAGGAVDQGLLDRYVQAWESADVDGLTALLVEEATFSMPPWPVWFRGRAAIAAALRRDVFAGATPDRDRLRPAAANGQPALAMYRRGDTPGEWAALGLQVLTLGRRSRRIEAVTVFLNPGLFSAFGLPGVLTA